MLKTNNLREFIEYLNEQVKNHSVYVWGAQGQLGPAVNERWIRQVETSDVDEGISRHLYLIMLGEQTSVVCPDDVCGVASVECHADVIGSDRDGHKAVRIIVENGHLVVD